jgi:hypothetical protein
MGLTNLSRDDVLRREPSPEVRHHSTIHAHGIGVVPAAAQIASEGLETYVKLAADIRVTVAAAPAWPLVHSESWKTQRFSRLRHASSYQICSKEKLKKRCN